MSKPLLPFGRRKNAPTLKSADTFLVIMLLLWLAACGIAISWFFLTS